MTANPTRVLLVEDSAGDARLIREMFRNEKPGSYELTHLSRMDEAITHLAKSETDIVLIDMGLPDEHGLNTMRRARAAAPGVPVIVLTGLDDEVLAAQAMKEGAEDYLIKDEIENRALPRALRHAIERHRLQTESELIRTQQLQFKDEFLSHVSHELRSPLTAIYQFVTILLDAVAGELNLKQGECLEIVLRNVSELQSMIDDLLEVTRMQAGKLIIEPQQTSVSDEITYTVNTFLETAAGKEITLSYDTTTPVPSVFADPTRLRQILLILFDNAIKFTPQGGTVKVQAQRFEKDPGFVRVEVSDSGCGVIPSMAEKIFDRLHQVASSASPPRKGLGLGLYICKELVLRQGGEIWVESSPRQGASFSFTLPVFSISSLLAPLVRTQTFPVDSVALMTVEMSSKDGWLSKESREEWARETRTVIHNCLLPDLDLLLPKMSSGGPSEVFFVAVFAREQGADVLARRIREQFGRIEHLRHAGLSLAVSWKFLSPLCHKSPGPAECSAEELATRIEQLIISEIHTRSTHYE
jgi:signal transduction histidine kinase